MALGMPKRMVRTILTLGVFFTLAGLLLYTFKDTLERSMLDPDIAFKRYAVGTTAKIKRKWAQKWKAKAHTKRNFYMSYDFTTKDGERTQGSGKLPLETWKIVQVGEPVQIFYLPYNPKETRINMRQFER